jgi:hypothetical protein
MQLKLRHFQIKHLKKEHSMKSLFLLLIFTAIWFPAFAESNNTINCDIQNQSCTQQLEDISITLDIEPKPVKAMQELTFYVTLTGSQSSAPSHIELGMPNMKMGPNQVILESVGEHTYQGTGFIVRCKSGKRTWYATVNLPNKGTVTFVFDVIYE